MDVVYNASTNRHCEPENPVFYATQTGTYYYFGGRMIKNESGWVYPDRLGSIGKFYPYGTERPSATTNGTEKFTGYFRDSETGLDYADQRYEQPGMGRFLTPDRMFGKPADPGSWNKYAYTRGDPINRIDPSGMDDCDPENPEDCYCQIYSSDPHCDPSYCPNGLCRPSVGQQQSATGGPYSIHGNWDYERQLLQDGKVLVASLIQDGNIVSYGTTKCNDDINALLSAVPDAVSASGLAAAVSAMVLTDGLLNSDFTVCQTLVPGAEGYDFYCNQHAGFTIGQLFANNTNTGAWAALPGSEAAGHVFFNPNFANPEPWTDNFAASLLLHEALHNLGGTDPDLLRVLGYNPNGPSSPINERLEADCFNSGPMKGK
jgi:RHS repeat-associated protein